MKIAIVGAGKSGMTILNTLNNIMDIEISCIVDKNHGTLPGWPGLKAWNKLLY